MTNQISGNPDPSRRPINTALFSDLTTKTVVSVTNPDGVSAWDGENDALVTFSGELTTVEYVACRRRLRCNADREALEVSAQNAITAHNNFLAIASPTNAQILAELRLLARVDKGLIKQQVPDLALLDPTPNA